MYPAYWDPAEYTEDYDYYDDQFYSEDYDQYDNAAYAFPAYEDGYLGTNDYLGDAGEDDYLGNNPEEVHQDPLEGYYAPAEWDSPNQEQEDMYLRWMQEPGWPQPSNQRGYH